MSERKWVFQLLVRDSNDPIGLIAYSLYKYAKAELAANLKEDGVSDEKINSELKIFHDQTIATQSQLDNYRQRAEHLVLELGELSGKAMFRDSLDDLELKKSKLAAEQATLNRDKANYQKDLQKEKTKQTKELIDQFRTAVKNTPKRSKKEAFAAWLHNGAYSLSSQIVIIAFIFGVALILNGGNEQLQRKISDSFVSVLLSSPLLIDSEELPLKAKENK